LEGDPKQIIVNALAVSALASAVFFAFALLIVLATTRRPST
jgi:hypothetical protein